MTILNDEDSEPRARREEKSAVSTTEQVLTMIEILLEKLMKGGGAEGGFLLI